MTKKRDLASSIGCLVVMLVLVAAAALAGAYWSSWWFLAAALAGLFVLILIPDILGRLSGPPPGEDLRQVMAGARSRKLAAREPFSAAQAAPTAAPKSEADMRFEEGLRLAAKGGYNGAIRELSGALELRPDWPDAYYYRAKARVELGDRHGMVSDFKKALGSAPGDWPHRGEVLAYTKPREHRGD
jgi:tetratricopeptide (TPR) repeat protein